MSMGSSIQPPLLHLLAAAREAGVGFTMADIHFRVFVPCWLQSGADDRQVSY